MQSQSFDFRIGKSTVQNIIRETYYGICQALLEKYLTTPESTEDWLHIAEGFQDEWNFPHCIGAIDGKHICIWNALEMVALHFIITKIFTVWH